MGPLKIGAYEARPALFQEHDPRADGVASLLIQAIQAQEPRLVVDHIGSTAVPGCRGKGIIDLAVTYAAGDLEPAKSALDALGFQRQSGREPFPETRPMRVGSFFALGQTFQIHAHVLEHNGDEHGKLVAFRDSLRRDPQLRQAYESDKERILSSGITDAIDYSNAKGDFIVAVLTRRTLE